MRGTLEEREQAITDCKFELVRDSSHHRQTPTLKPVEMPAMPANEVTAYLESSGLEKELADCVNQVVREKAPDALARLSELLAAKGGKPVTPPLCDYLDTVGNTPLVKLGKCLPEGVKAARVLAKLEMCNPGGSLKDGIALQMIETAEKQVLLCHPLLHQAP